MRRIQISSQFQLISPLASSRLSKAVCVGLLAVALCISGGFVPVRAQDSATVTITPVTPKPRPRPKPKPRPAPKPRPRASITRTSPSYPALPAAILLVDGKVIDSSSVEVVRGQYVMMSLREMEQLGWGTVEASGSNYTLRSKNIVLTFTKGSDRALLNSLVGPLPVKTYMKNTRLMVPLSFVAKAMGFDFTSDTKVVVAIGNRVEPETPAGPNAIRGRVIYDGAGIAGVRVRAIGKDAKPVKGGTAVTDDDGMYTLKGLLNSEYTIYVTNEDNPGYFTRSTDTIQVSDGKTAELKPIYMTAVIKPLKPKPNASVSIKGSVVDFVWSTCRGASYYKFLIRKIDTDEAVVQMRSNEPALKVSTSSFDLDSKYEAEVSAYNSTGEFLGGTQGGGGDSWTFTTSWE